MSPLIEQVKTWEEAEEKMNSILEEHRSSQSSEVHFYISQPLFRGQPNSNWKLDTTLERLLKEESISVAEYHSILEQILNQVSSWDQKKWEIEDYGEFCLAPKPDKPRIPQKTYEFMAYLRHHGFPSPLLDWTHSPYIAAFFAFRNIPIDAKTVSIFIYQQNLGNGTETDLNKPHIGVMGPNISTHYRHYKQQSEYTICIQKENGQFFYKTHQLVFDRDAEDQDKLMELKILAEEKQKVMRRLMTMNINSASLFENEDGFVQGIGEEFFYK